MICDKIVSDKDCNTIVKNEGFNFDYVYVYILQLNKANGKSISQTFFRTSPAEEIKFTIGQDGYYTLCKLKIPLDTSMPYHYKDGKFMYKGIKEVTLYELLSVDPEISQLKITYYYYFQLCKLRKCYVNIVKKILDDRASLNCNNNGVDKNDIYKRDLLSSAISVISYLAEIEQFEEAERLLERISSCNGLCDTTSSNSCGCGCGG